MRHNALRDMTAEHIQDSTGTPAMVEQHNEAHGDDRRPDIHYQDHRGETTWLDVAVVSPNARTQAGRTMRAGAAVAAHESTKRRKYPALKLLPLVTSHLGRAGQDLTTFVRALHRHPDSAVRSADIAGFWQSWSCCLQHWNVKILASAGLLTPP